MKSLIKIITLFFFILVTSVTSFAQLKPGMMIFGYFKNDSLKVYSAEILTVDGVEFTCRFSHSSSIYKFQITGYEPNENANLLKAQVISSIGGKYKKNDTFLYAVFETDNSTDCFATPDEGRIVLVKFPDSKTFIAVVIEGSYAYNVQFLHSNNIYGFDKSFKIVKSTGFYKPGIMVTLLCGHEKDL